MRSAWLTGTGNNTSATLRGYLSHVSTPPLCPPPSMIESCRSQKVYRLSKLVLGIELFLQRRNFLIFCDTLYLFLELGSSKIHSPDKKASHKYWECYQNQKSFNHPFLTRNAIFQNQQKVDHHSPSKKRMDHQSPSDLQPLTISNKY